MINKILRSIRRFIMGETYKFTIKKGSTSFNGSSWVPIFTEMTEYPLKLISVTFLMEKETIGEYRIVCDGQKMFPFNECSQIENGVTRNFIIPINISAGSYLQIEVRSEINNKNIIVMDEIACIEVI